MCLFGFYGISNILGYLKINVFVWVSWNMKFCKLFNAKSILYKETVLIQAIQFSMSQ